MLIVLLNLCLVQMQPKGVAVKPHTYLLVCGKLREVSCCSKPHWQTNLFAAFHICFPCGLKMLNVGAILHSTYHWGHNCSKLRLFATWHKLCIWEGETSAPKVAQVEWSKKQKKEIVGKLLS